MGAFVESAPPCRCCTRLVTGMMVVMVLLLVGGWPWEVMGLVKVPPQLKIPAVFVLGDSVMDTGNNNDLVSLAKCNYLPYGRDFKGGVATGRCCNGKVPSDIIVEELGIKELLPPYKDRNLKPQDLLTGVNFASAAAGYDPLTTQLARAISMTEQVKWFGDYKEKIRGIVGDEQTKFIMDNSVVVVVAGSDDIANTYYGARVRQLQYDISSYTDLMVNGASDIVKGLYEVGSRRIGVFGTPPVGCLPSQRTLLGGLKRSCSEKENTAAKLFNSKLQNRLEQLQQQLPNSTIRYVDIYNPLLDVIVNYKKYGLKVSDRGCCGTGIIEAAFLCNRYTPTCPDIENYVFWDTFHPTEGTYRKLIPPILQKYVDDYARGIR